jgi:3-methyladenine DNA glycosylase/8-oxoguanine DNA glycosylase
MRPQSYSSLYEYLIIAIVLQNCTVRRSVNMLRALFEKYGTRVAYDGKTLDCFWTPKEIALVSEQELRGLKVGYRAKSIQRVTEAFVRAQVDEIELRAKSADEQREMLLGLYGIGPASVGYILFSVFHRFDGMNHISPWEQKIYSRLLLNRNSAKPVSAERLLRLIGKRFAGFKDLAVHYIWEDLFWKRKQASSAWLEELIRL